MPKPSAQPDAMADKKMFHKMLKQAMPKKVVTHLKGDIREQASGIKKDRHLIKAMGKKGGRGA